ncbi:MAG: hypothetical protein Q8N95_11985 [Desulfobacterales bacterium]|nr:hypothetical protein [Desulfobacterales bacterium]
MNSRYIDLEIQGGVTRRFTDLVLDYTGTLSLDGVLLPGVAERLSPYLGRPAHYDHDSRHIRQGG